MEKRQPKQFSGENYTFHQIIKEKYGLKVATHYGIGGTRIARQTVPTREKTRWDYTFEMRAEIMDRDVDAMLEICKKRNIKVIDLFKINSINPMDKNVVPDVVDNNNKEMQLLAFCEKFRTQQEIADFLGIKTLPHAVKNHVMPLVDKGLIELEYPEKPRSSKQRYKTRQ